MRILLDLQPCQTSNRNRGIGRYSLSLARAMLDAGQGHDFWVLLNNAWPDENRQIRQALQGLLPAQQIVEFSGQANPAFIEARGRGTREAAQLIREHRIRQINPDAIHVTSLFEGYEDNAVLSLEAPDLAARTFVTLYDLIPLIMAEHYLQDALFRRWFYQGLQGLKRARGLLAISESSRQEAISQLGCSPERVHNIGCAIDPQFKPTSCNAQRKAELTRQYGLSRPFVMYTGGINYRKNIEGLISAWAQQSADTRRRWQLAIVCQMGDHSRQQLLAQARREGLADDDLCLTGFVPDSDLIALYSACDLFVFPSLHEGFGLPALEAMACGAAVITADCSSLPEVTGMAQAMFDPRQPEAIAAAIEQALHNPQLRQQLLDNGQQRPPLFSWQRSARQALTAIEQAVAADRGQPQPECRPHLAWVSPMPPARSGVAVYAHYMLVELLRDYRITVVTPDPSVDSPWVEACCEVITPQQFLSDSGRFDRVLYHLGNSEFHAHMVDMLERCPGVVVMHDCYLGGMLNYLEGHTGQPYFQRELLHSHGYAGLHYEQQQGRIAAIRRYPCSASLLSRARQTIVHSRHAADIVSRSLDSEAISKVPLIAPPLTLPARQQARQQLDIADDAMVIVSFGFVTPGKCSAQLLDAFIQTASLQANNALLCFVGSDQGADYGQQLQQQIQQHELAGRVRITGFVDTADYQRYLAAADIAVQLRTDSRGETSAAILECLTAGLPLIVNRHGSAAELPADSCINIAEQINPTELAQALEQLQDTTQRQQLAQAGPRWIARQHAPAVAARGYREAIEQAWQAAAPRHHDQLIARLGELRRGPHSADTDWAGIAQDLTEQQPGSVSQVMDISPGWPNLASLSDAQRSAAREFLLDETHSAQRQLVYQRDGRWYCAHQAAAALLGLSWTPLADCLLSGAGQVRFYPLAAQAESGAC